MNTLVTQTEHQHEHLVGITLDRSKVIILEYLLVTMRVTMLAISQEYLRENTLEII